MRGASWSWSVRKSSICVAVAEVDRELVALAALARRAAPRCAAARSRRRARPPSVRRVASRPTCARWNPRCHVRGPCSCTDEVPQVRVVADEQLGDRVDEVIGLGRAEAVEHRRLARPRRATTSVCGNEPRPSPSHQCSTRIGSSTTTPAGTWTNAPPARNASCSTVNASSASRSTRARASVCTSSSLARRDAADAHALGFERGIDLVVHDAAVAHDDHRRVRARLPPPTARRPARARRRARRARLRSNGR